MNSTLVIRLHSALFYSAWLASALCSDVLRAADAAPETTVAAKPGGLLLYPFPAKEAAQRDVSVDFEGIHAETLDWLERAQQQVPKLVPVAERIAERLAKGGGLYVAGNPGFVDELVSRAGGFPFAKKYDKFPLGPNDVVFLGQFRPDETQFNLPQFFRSAEKAEKSAPLIVWFTSYNWPLTKGYAALLDNEFWAKHSVVVDTGAPAGPTLADLSLCQTSTAAMAWVLQGEMISAATRKGVTFATYSSDFEPGSKEWDASVKELVLHNKFSVPPIEAGKIAREFLQICKRQIGEFSAKQGAQLHLGAKRLADHMIANGRVWALFGGHIHNFGSVAPRELEQLIFLGRANNFTMADRIPKGDMVLWFGYMRYPQDKVDVFLQRGCNAVVFTVDDGPTNANLTHIRSHWEDFDSVVALPDYPIRVLPSSGVVSTPQWYSLMAEIIKVRNAKK
jgi:hypothetical protein